MRVMVPGLSSMRHGFPGFKNLHGLPSMCAGMARLHTTGAFHLVLRSIQCDAQLHVCSLWDLPSPLTARIHARESWGRSARAQVRVERLGCPEGIRLLTADR